MMLTLSTVAVTGCAHEGRTFPRQVVSGTVDFEGQPLQKGTIQFQPASQVDGTLAVGTITDGRFEIPAVAGPSPGRDGVAIYNDDELPPAPAAGEMPGPPAAPKKKAAVPIPSRYNAKTELTAEVKAGGPNVFTFNLKKQ
jgi:hypothetical protein